MKKNIQELSGEELVFVWENNQKLQDIVEEDYIESEMYYISEILSEFSLSLRDWSIGFYNQNYIRIKDNEQFLTDAIDATKKCGFLADRHKNLTDELQELWQKYNYGSEENIEELEEKIEEKTEELMDIVIDTFNIFTTIEPDYLLNYFVEFYVDSRMDETYYIDENYSLFQDIAYTKNFN